MLLDASTDPLATCVTAAKVCRSEKRIADLSFYSNQEDDSEYLGRIIKMGHLSVIEHANYTFGIDGISRACSHQLVRHRVASYSQQSQKFVFMNTDKLEDLFVVPPEIFKHFGPDCVTSGCKQGAKTCGSPYRKLISEDK